MQLQWVFLTFSSIEVYRKAIPCLLYDWFKFEASSLWATTGKPSIVPYTRNYVIQIVLTGFFAVNIFFYPPWIYCKGYLEWNCEIHRIIAPSNILLWMFIGPVLSNCLRYFHFHFWYMVPSYSSIILHHYFDPNYLLKNFEKRNFNPQ